MSTPSLNPPVLDRSRPIVRRPVELATHLGLKIYNRTFSRIEAAMYLAEVIAHLQGRASRDHAAEIDQVIEAINGELDRLEALATGETRQLARVSRKAAAAGAPTEVSYTRPARVELTMRAPGMRRYAGLVAGAEQIARELDRAWYAGAVTTAARLERENLLFRHFMRACGVVERLARGLARRVRDDTEAPGYGDMLRKRTGRGPDAVHAPAVTDEDREGMTAEEARSLQATEALAGSLMAADPEAARSGPAADPDTTVGEPSAGAAGENAKPGEGRAREESAETALAAASGETFGPAAEAPAEAVKPRRRSVRDLIGAETGA